jgi:hypothetical protein
MAIDITSVVVKDALYNGSVNWLLANVGDLITIEVDFTVKTYALASTDAPWVFNNKDGYLPSGSTVWITGGDFREFLEGDTVQFNNYVTGVSEGTSTIVEKLSDNEIRIATNPGSWAANTVGTQNVVSVTIPITALYYQWNFIENGEGDNFVSKIDGSEHNAYITGLNAAGGGVNKPMIFTNPLPSQIGTATIDEISLTTTTVYESRFLLKHTTRVTPIMLAQQWDDLVSGIKPDYFLNQNCLKNIFRLEARYVATNPNRKQDILVSDVLGNSGWYGENYNTNLTNYSADTLSYNSGANKLELKTAVQTFTFKIKNATNSPFVSGSTKLVLNFAKAPNDESEYVDNNRLVRNNFVWEVVTLTVNTSPTPVNGENFGTSSLQSLKNVIATRNSASEITVSGQIELGSVAKTVFEESAEPRYIMFASIADHTKTNGASDRVTLLIDKSPFFYATAFPTFLKTVKKIIPHYINDITTSYNAALPIYEEDESVGYLEFDVLEDANTTPLTKQFIRATGSVVAINTVSGETFTLEQRNLNIANTPYVGNYQFLDTALTLPYHVPSNEIRKQFKVVTNNVTNGEYYMLYPYLNRWEYWTALQNVNPSFFNLSEPNNGYNQEWIRYTVGDWKIAFAYEIVVKIGGALNSYTGIVDYDLNPRNTSDEVIATLKSYDPDTMTELVDISGNRYLLGYKPTLIVAVFTQSWGSYSTLGGVLGIEEFEEGGVLGKRRMSSVFASDNDTWFISTLGNGKAELTFDIPVEVATLKALVNHNDLSKSKYKLTGRLYDSRTTPNPNLNYLIDGEFKVIRENPIDETPTVITEKQIDCCSDFVWRVFGKASDTNNELVNDKNGFIWDFDFDVINPSSVALELFKNNVYSEDLDDATFGTYYPYNFFKNNDNRAFVGYQINWGKVLNVKGAGIYKVKLAATTIFGSTITLYSDSFCVKEYNESIADKTVRIEYYINGIIGDKNNDKKSTDYGTLNWYNSHRFDGYFMYEKSRYTTEYVRYENGQDEKVIDEQYQEYTLNLEPIPAFKHSILNTDILQADDVEITDYNSRNFDKYYKKSVQKISEYAPKMLPLKTKLAPVEIKFKPKYNNLKRFRS